MPPQASSDSTQSIVRLVLAFVLTTKHLDSDFETRLGVNRHVLAELLMRWPAVNDRVDDSPSAVAINNALNEVVHGLVLSGDDWQQLGATRAQVAAAYVDWTTKRGWKSTGLR